MRADRRALHPVRRKTLWFAVRPHTTCLPPQVWCDDLRCRAERATETATSTSDTDDEAGTTCPPASAPAGRAETAPAGDPPARSSPADGSTKTPRSLRKATQARRQTESREYQTVSLPRRRGRHPKHRLS